MKTKKDKKANLENKKGMFFLIGLVIALGLVFIAFEWKTKANTTTFLLSDSNYSPIADYVYIPSTQSEEKEIPLPKIEVPSFELVDNSNEVVNEPAFIDTDPAAGAYIGLKDLIYNPKANTKDNVETIYEFVQEMPQFPGGDTSLLKFLSLHIKYPVIAKENRIEGRVYVSFVIDEQGFTRDVTIVRGVDPSLDNEALRVVRSMPQWKPGKQGGVPVKVRYYVPIHFDLQ